MEDQEALKRLATALVEAQRERDDWRSNANRLMQLLMASIIASGGKITITPRDLEWNPYAGRLEEVRCQQTDNIELTLSHHRPPAKRASGTGIELYPASTFIDRVMGALVADVERHKQSDIAKLLDVSEPYISSLKKRTNLKLSSVAKIAGAIEALDVERRGR